MTFDQFLSSLAQDQPPAHSNPVLQGLWYDANNHWEQAHAIAQDKEGTQAYDHLHAYLHRKEGDRFNASYWYRRAGVNSFTGTLEEEWDMLVKKYL